MNTLIKTMNSLIPTTEDSMSSAYHSLLLKSLGDRSLVERLVGYELNRSSGISINDAIERANRRWERDLSR